MPIRGPESGDPRLVRTGPETFGGTVHLPPRLSSQVLATLAHPLPFGYDSLAGEGARLTPDRERLKELERGVRELRGANEILRKASAYFAQAELDRRPR
jgi:hypothetical protein